VSIIFGVDEGVYPPVG